LNKVLQPILKYSGISLHFSFQILFPTKQNKSNSTQQTFHTYLPLNFVFIN